MLRRNFLGLASAGLHHLLHSRSTFLLESDAPSANSGFAPVNGLQLYYEIHGAEIHGEARPLVLLHGGVAASEAFGPNLPALAKTRKVIAMHLQGHGHTKDIDRPLRFELMADDVAGLIAYLKLGKADVLGYSLGGGVALQTAIRHADVVDHLIVVSEAVQRSGWYPEVDAAFDQMAAMAPQVAQNIKRSSIGRMYPNVNWETLLKKIAEMESQDYDWSAAVRQIALPTMLIFADADAVRPDHIVAFYEALGGGKRDAGLDGSLRAAARLGILPGATHYNILATTMVAEMAGTFLS